ncbi:sugar phosphate isomerase/epimerase [Verrucomicrobiales bacterium]|nr:sugar phosphate isomerase/epimerase [Verrucomicrobiales bacterium]MDC0276055.1 sugar phosphate isomerase/epimerase [Verrucomicrobiales bacterium]
MSVQSDSLSDRLTIRLEVLPGKTVREKVEMASQCGFDGIAFPGRFRSQFGEEMLASLADLPIPIETVSLGFEGSLCSPDPALRQECRDSLLELFDFTAQLGAKSVNLPPVLILDNPERFPIGAIQEQDQLLIEQLPRLGDEAQARGVELLIEPVNAAETDYLTTIEHAARLCEAVNHPAVGLTPDFFHMHIEESDIPSAIRNSMPWIRHIHTAEVMHRHEPMPGKLNHRPGFRALKDAGYTGLVEVECRSLSGPAEEVLPRAVAFLCEEWALA